jgi:membrane associated rhomboid family serine protease
MLLPLGDDSLNRRSPVVNSGIVLVNVVVFAAVNVFDSEASAWKIIKTHGLVPASIEPLQFLTSIFLHGGWMHLIGNMWFLWVFGPAIENRLGHLGYGVFYLLAGIGASGVYLLLTPKTMIPCIGASGAIFGVVGAYALLYPRNQVRMLYWLGWFFAGTFHVSAMWIVGFWLVEQVFLWYLMSEILGGGLGGVAYAAHVGGLLALGVRMWVPEPSLALGPPGASSYGQGGGAWGTGPYAPPDPALLQPTMTAEPATATLAVPTDSSRGSAQELTPPADEVAKALLTGDLDHALVLYRQHAVGHPGSPLAASTQVAVAHALFEKAEFSEALEAYRLYLGRHRREPDAPHAKFRAAAVLSRKLDCFEEASRLLLEVVMEHGDPEVVDLAREELARIRQTA